MGGVACLDGHHGAECSLGCTFLRTWLDASAPQHRMVDSLIETENCGKFQPELGLVCGIPYQHEVLIKPPGAAMHCMDKGGATPLASESQRIKRHTTLW